MSLIYGIFVVFTFINGICAVPQRNVTEKEAGFLSATLPTIPKYDPEVIRYHLKNAEPDFSTILVCIFAAVMFWKLLEGHNQPEFGEEERRRWLEDI